MGKVGSGKSSLLNAIIGEMRRTQGEISVQDLDKGFAYVAQEPWVQHATVRDNILFGSPFDGQRYDKVIEACALTDDFKVCTVYFPQNNNIIVSHRKLVNKYNDLLINIFFSNT